jgi:hypothetical protein
VHPIQLARAADVLDRIARAVAAVRHARDHTALSRRAALDRNARRHVRHPHRAVHARRAAGPHRHVFQRRVRLDNVERTSEELRARGVEFTGPPQKQPWGTFATFKDVDGNEFVIGTAR